MNESINIYLPDFIYGSIDGIITNFVIIAGVAGSGLPDKTVIILGLANAIADAFSMATSRYLSNDKHEWKNALVTFISFVALGIIPLLPFITKSKNKKKERKKAFKLSYVLTVIMLMIIGMIKGYFLESSMLYYGLETLLIGGIASALSYYIANLATKI
jgi:vacuolar iron transporter family protein